MMRVLEVFWVFLRLGCTSFGGPVAHLGFFHAAFVEKLKWIDEETYSDTLALCQFLPGPASSQLGFAIGLMRAGFLGGFAAWVGFTLPSAALMIGFGMGMIHYGPDSDAPWLQGLKIAVVVVVAKAVWGMAKTLTPDRPRITLGIACCILMLWLGTAWAQVAVIAAGGLVGMLLFRSSETPKTESGFERKPMSRAVGAVWLLLFFALLIGLPIAAQTLNDPRIDFVSGFYRGGSLVFGGGHVVLPLLQETFVTELDLMTDDTFMAGYGAAQAVPGPLFTISAYLGTVANGTWTGILGGIIALVAIFLPSWLLVLGGLPFWQILRGNRVFAAALRGANAAVVGILLAALYDPVWTHGILSTEHFMIGLGLFLLVQYWKLPPWASVLLAAGAGALILGS